MKSIRDQVVLSSSQSGRRWGVSVDVIGGRETVSVTELEAPQPPDPAKRFRERLKTEAGCLVYTGLRTRKGYGYVWFDGKNVFTHRLAWQLANGPIPRGLCVLHRCDNRACCKPEHLFLGTLADNNRDMASKARGRAKLTPQQVREIRTRYASGESSNALAEEFGVAQSTTRHIVTGRSWAYCAESFPVAA